MRVSKTFEEHPPNTKKNVEIIVTAKFNLIDRKMTDLLEKFITLLGKEDENWGGVEAMKACRSEFFRERPQLRDRVPTVKDLEEFLFSDNRYVRLVIQGPGVVDPPTIPGTVKRADRTSTGKEISSNVPGPPANPKSLKESDRPSTSTVVNPDVVNKTSVLPAKLKTLKVKIYMGSGWNNTDFPKLSTPYPSLYVKLKIDGGKSHETKVQTESATPCWGEEFVFPLSHLRDVNLIVEVYDHIRPMKKEFAGKIGLLVSESKQGIHTIFLSNRVGNPCSSWLIMRLMFD